MSGGGANARKRPREHAQEVDGEVPLDHDNNGDVQMRESIHARTDSNIGVPSTDPASDRPHRSAAPRSGALNERALFHNQFNILQQQLGDASTSQSHSMSQ